MPVKRVLVIVMVSALLLAVGVGPGATKPARALPEWSAEAARGTIPYAGRLTDKAGQPVVGGAYDLSFTLYGTVSGGQSLWSEMQRGVVVSRGEFLTTLGSVEPIPATALSGQSLWLAVAVRGPSEAGFTALAPRQRVSAASPTAGAACPHDHLGEWWTGDPGTGNNGLRVESTRTDSNGITGVAHNGTNAVGVFGWTTQGVGVQGSSDSSDGVKGTSNTGTGVYGHCSGLVCYGMFSDGDMAVAGSLWVDSALTVQGYATFSGGKSGYVVEIAQNDDSVPLEAGDVIVISGAGLPVVGEIPVIKVRRATTGGTSAVVGVVDKYYVLTPKTAAPDGRAEGVFDETVIAPGEYLSVVTLGAYKAIRVDASYGPIAPGDLLVLSPNPGHAMRADSPQPGTIIGKALGELLDGTGVIPVIVTLQ
jgi:hypothetical protein